jgi:hypothetical protein
MKMNAPHGFLCGFQYCISDTRTILHGTEHLILDRFHGEYHLQCCYTFVDC